MDTQARMDAEADADTVFENYAQPWVDRHIEYAIRCGWTHIAAGLAREAAHAAFRAFPGLRG